MLGSLPPALQVLIFIFLVIFMSVFAELIWGLSLSIIISNEAIVDADWSDPRIYLSRVLFSQVFAFLVSLLLFLRYTGERFSELIQVKKTKLILACLIVLSALASLFFFPLLEQINEPLRYVLPRAMLTAEAETDALQTQLIFTDDTIQYFFLMITMALLPAIFEELIFRGLLIKKMIQSGISEHLAIWMSATIFSISHFQPMKFIAMLVLGAALGYIYRKFGNIKYSILFHFVINGSQITIGYLSTAGLIDPISI